MAPVGFRSITRGVKSLNQKKTWEENGFKSGMQKLKWMGLKLPQTLEINNSINTGAQG